MIPMRIFRFTLLAILAASTMSVQAAGSGGFFSCKKTPITDVRPLTITEAAGVLGLTGLADLISPDIAELLDSSQDITVFAPDNDAVDALLDGVAPNSPDVVDTILAYHVVPKLFDPRKVGYIRKVPSLLGQDLFVSRSKDGPGVNQSNVIDCQGYRTANGLVWVIDSVLLPQFFPAD